MLSAWILEIILWQIFTKLIFYRLELQKSGNAICLLYETNGQIYTHVVDGGYEANGQSVLDRLSYYYNGNKIDHVVATHPDGDHAVGLRTVLEQAEVGVLWMNRPWIHAQEPLPYFAKYANAESLAKALRDVFTNLAKLEDIAIEWGIPIHNAYQGAKIGAITVLAPSRNAFFNYVADDSRTPKVASETATRSGMFDGAIQVVAEGLRLIMAAWGAEKFPADDTSPRNNISVVQFANFSGEQVVLTAEAGRAALDETATYAPFVGLTLPANEIWLIQVPHHGSRHNVSTKTLDRWLGRVGEEHQELRSMPLSVLARMIWSIHARWSSAHSCTGAQQWAKPRADLFASQAEKHQVERAGFPISHFHTQPDTRSNKWRPFSKN